MNGVVREFTYLTSLSPYFIGHTSLIEPHIKKKRLDVYKNNLTNESDKEPSKLSVLYLP